MQDYGAPALEALLDRVDGICLSGGPDIHPSAYGHEPVDELGPTEPALDAFELALARAADRRGLPILGICRGAQLLNVARGGTLRQHLPAEAGHRPAPGTFGSHRVRLASGSRLASILRPGGGPAGLTLNVPTAHHQGIARLGDGLVPAAWADDGLIEAVELAHGPGQHPFMLAVQWHPEAGQDRRLVSALVAAAAADGRGHRAMAE